MYILLGDRYGTMFEEGALRAPEVAQAFQRWVCPAIRSPYINWMLHDATVTIQAIRPYGLGMFSGDLLEGSKRVLKDIWSSFCDRGGGAITLVSRSIKMLRQVNERLFLYFEVPRWNGNSRSNLCNAQKLADEARAYFTEGNCGSARYLFFSARYMLSSARNDHYRARYAVFKRRNP